MKLFKRPALWPLIIILVLMAIPILLMGICKLFGLVITYTGSVPPGLYRIKPADKNQISQGDYIAFCLPDKIAQYGMKRGYIHQGDCTNGSQELIKEVIALPQDHVRITEQAIWVGKYRYTAPVQKVDHAGKWLERWVKNGINQPHGYWVYGVGSPEYSWDSRYYGSINFNNIRHKMVPVWLF